MTFLSLCLLLFTHFGDTQAADNCFALIFWQLTLTYMLLHTGQDEEQGVGNVLISQYN